MKLRWVISMFIALYAFLNGEAVEITRHVGEVDNGYNFWLAKPDSLDVPKPIIIFLHGASLCGNNLDKVKRYGTLDAVERGRNIDAYIIAPQNPGGGWNPEKIMNVLEWVEENNNVDTTRVYVIGMSLGGYGTIDFTATYPDKIAAAIAMCGGATKKDLSGLTQVPLWIVHGTGDHAVSVTQSDRIVAAMEQTDSIMERLIYDRVPGMNHSQPARLFYVPDIYDWLFAHSLLDEGRPLNYEIQFTDDLVKNAYTGLTYTSKKNTSGRKTKRNSRTRTTRKKK